MKGEWNACKTSKRTGTAERTYFSALEGYIEGLKYGSIIIILTLIISLIIKSFNIKLLIFYSILLLSSTLGSMIGITRKN